MVIVHQVPIGTSIKLWIVACAIGAGKEYGAVDNRAELVAGVAGVLVGVVAGCATGGEVLQVAYV